MPDPQSPKPKRKTDKQREKEQQKDTRELRKQEEARVQQRKREEKEKEKKAKGVERANHNGKKEEDKLPTAPTAASPSQNKSVVQGLQATLQCGVGVGLFKSNGKSNGK